MQERPGTILLSHRKEVHSAGMQPLPPRSAWHLLRRSRNAEVFRVPGKHPHEFLIAKGPLSRTPKSRSVFQKEFEGLLHVQERAGEVLAGTFPRPVAYLQDLDTMILAGVRGQRLNARLHWTANVATGWANIARIQKIGQALGVWLRTFQDVMAEGTRFFVPRNYVAQLEHVLSRSRELGISAAALQQVRNLLVAESEVLEGAAMPLAAAHGDFVAHNILVEGVKPKVVDFSGYDTRQPVYRDVSAFIADAVLRSRKRVYSLRALQALVT